MRALRIHAYGGPEQLKVDEVPAPHAGPGEVRIKVSAASINPLDGKILRGLLAGGAALAEPTGLGFDASGVVDEVGEGVAGVSVGDDVFGLGRADPGRARGADRLDRQARLPGLGGRRGGRDGGRDRDPGAGPARRSAPARPC